MSRSLVSAHDRRGSFPEQRRALPLGRSPVFLLAGLVLLFWGLGAGAQSSSQGDEQSASSQRQNSQAQRADQETPENSKSEEESSDSGSEDLVEGENPPLANPSDARRQTAGEGEIEGEESQDAEEAMATASGPGMLIVGTKEAAPFAFKDEKGQWQGLSIELWRSVAEELEIDFEFREMPLQDLVEGVENGSLAVAVAALTITEEREAAFDFSHPFYTSGLGIAIADGGSRWISFLRGLFSFRFIQVVVVLSLILLLAGTLLWFFERRNNTDQFGERWFQGLGHAFWWSAVTMTTVGYGDKAPVTLGGRVVALVWMFASVILISTFTAGIASSLTAQEFHRNAVQGPNDLPKVAVGTVGGTTSQSYLQSEAVSHQVRPAIREALEDVLQGKLQAVVYDAPILLYMAQQEGLEDLKILPSTFNRQDYGVAFPTGSPLRERVNLAVLKHIRSPEWQETQFKYLGEVQ